MYLGRDSRLDRPVAIKVVRGEVRDREALDRFFREARAAAALRHPNLVTIYASGQHEHQPYMVMEFVDGESLADVIRQRRHLMLSDKLSYIEQTCAGLHYAHHAGIVHRDIKPANLMVDRQGVIRILDFGIARIEGSAMTLDGAMVGSLNYMSPEQMLGKPVDHRSDMFSLGSVAYELLCYRQAFRGGMNDGLLQRLPHEDPPSLTTLRQDVPRELEQIITRALKKAPEERYPDLNAMRDAILEVKHDLGQDDVRTIVVRPMVHTASDVFAPPQSTGIPLQSEASPKPDTFWGQTRAESSDASAAQPAWATTPSTRVIRPPTTPSERRPTPGPASRPSTGSTTRTRLASTALPPLVVSASPGRGILLGSILGVGAIAVLSAMSWRATPPPTALEREGPAIDAALSQFRTAYRTRDIDAMMAVFPTLPPTTKQAMRRTFATCLVYEVTYDGIQVAIDPQNDTRATADVRSLHTCTPASGGRETTTDEHDIFSLRKQGEAWLVDKTQQTTNRTADRTR